MLSFLFHIQSQQLKSPLKIYETKFEIKLDLMQLLVIDFQKKLERVVMIHNQINVKTTHQIEIDIDI
jgi:hypothetical protein